MNYLLTVIIPTYNAENSIKRAVNSIKEQTISFENIELIIIDDNSKDKTPAIIKELSKQNPNIKSIFLKENSGSAGKGRNIGIENAESNYLMFLDQDDKYDRNFCKAMYETIQKDDVDLVMSNHKTFLNNQFDENDSENNDFTFIKANPKENENIFNKIYMWDKIFKRDFLLKNNIRCPENFLSEDLYFCSKAYLNTEDILYLKKYYGYLYNIRDSKEDLSTSNSITKEKYLKLLKGFYATIDLFKEAKKEDLIPLVMKTHFVTLISSFIILNANEKEKIEILEKLFEFKEYSGINYELNEKWANFFNRNIGKRNFKRVIFASEIVKQFYKFHSIRKIYRSFYNKLSN